MSKYTVEAHDNSTNPLASFVGILLDPIGTLSDKPSYEATIKDNDGNTVSTGYGNTTKDAENNAWSKLP